MRCKTIAAGPGITAIVCGSRAKRKPCSVPNCTGTEIAACDYPVVRKGLTATCDRGMCATHRTSAGDDIDYCPPHAAKAKAKRETP